MDTEKIQEDKENVVEIEEVKEEPKVDKPAESDVKDEFSSEEIKMAKEHKLIAEGGEKDGKEEDKKSEESKKEESGKEEKKEEVKPVIKTE